MDVTQKEVIVVILLFAVILVIGGYSFFLSNNGITGGVIGLGSEILENLEPSPSLNNGSSQQEQEENSYENNVAEENKTERINNTIFSLESTPIRTAATQNINNCTSLLTSGTTYLLTQDASNVSTCFSIYASNIELDCQGFSVDFATTGTNDFQSGINSTGYNNLTIRNCRINYLTGSTNTRNYAINFENSNSTRILNNTINIATDETRSTLAIRLNNSDNATIENNSIVSNEINIVLLGDGSDFNLIRHNNITSITTLTSSILSGIIITSNSNQNNYIEENKIGTFGVAIRLDNANYTYLVNNNLSSSRTFEIMDNTDAGSLNFLIYNDSFVDLRWANNGSGSFYENLTVNTTYGIGVGLGIFFANNTFASNFTEGQSPPRRSKINSTANITFKGLAFGSINELRRVENFTYDSDVIRGVGYNCSSAGLILCEIMKTYSGGILQFNITAFSSFTANGSSAAAGGGDTTPPSVINVTPVADSSFTVGNIIEIGANVTDDVMVSQVFANLSYPNGSIILFDLSNGTGFFSRFNLSFTIPSVTGNYNITFIANDTTNNRNSSVRTNFTVSTAPSPASSSGGSGSKKSYPLSTSKSKPPSLPPIITSRPAIKVKAPLVPLQLSATIPALPPVAPYLSWDHPLTIFVDKEKPVKVTVDQRIKKSGRTILHTRSTFLITTIAQLTNRVKGLNSGNYQIEFTITAEKQTITIVKDLIVDSFFSTVMLEEVSEKIMPAVSRDGGGRSAVPREEHPASELKNIQDLERLRKITPVKIVVENKQNKVMKLFPDLYQKLDDPYFIVTRKTLGYDGSLFEKIYGVSYSPNSVAARLLNAEIVNPEQIILNPGEKIEKIIYLKEGLANPDPLIIQLYTEEGVQFEQEVDVDDKFFSGVAFDVDPASSKMDIYAFVVPPATTQLLEEYYAQKSNSLTSAVIFEGQPKQYDSYMIEVSMRRKGDQWDGNVFHKTYNSIVSRKRYLFELYGPYNLREKQIFVFAQQLNYNPQEYYGDYVLEAIIYRNGDVFLKSNYDLNLGEQKRK